MDHVQRLIFAVLVALPSLAWGAACPIDYTGFTPSEWPTSRTESSTWSATYHAVGIPVCGISPDSSPPGGYSTSGHASLAAGYAAILAAGYSGWITGPQCAWTNGSSSHGMSYVFEHPTTPGHYRAFRVYASTTAAECEPVVAPPACGDGTKGKLAPIRATTPDAIVAIAGDCYQGCAVSGVTIDPIGIDKEADGTFYFLPFVKFSGASCSPVVEPDIPPPDAEATIPPEGEVCKTSLAGTVACTSTEAYGENCGYVNDKAVCLGRTDDDECWINGDGSRLCGASAPTPPVPDNGTGGVKAVPDDTVAAKGPDGTTNNYNYYGTATVAGSERVAGDNGANPGRADSTNPTTTPIPTVEQGAGGDGTGEDPGPTGTASGGATCDAPPVCTHDDPVQCAMLEQQWRTRCVDVPTAEDALTAIGATPEEIAGDLSGGADPIDIGGLNADGGFSGTCPAPINVSVMGQSISLDIWLRACEMAVLFAPFVMIMGYVMAMGIIVRGVK